MFIKLKSLHFITFQYSYTLNKCFHPTLIDKLVYHIIYLRFALELDAKCISLVLHCNIMTTKLNLI